MRLLLLVCVVLMVALSASCAADVVKTEVPPRMSEVDATPFVPLLEGKKVDGYCAKEIYKGIFLVLNRGGMVDKRAKAGGLIRDQLDPFHVSERESQYDAYFLHSKKEKATEAFIVIKNKSEETMCFLELRLNINDVGTAGLPPKYSFPVDPSRDANLKSGEWVYKKYLAVKIRVEDLKSERNLLKVDTGFLRRKGNEGEQYTAPYYSLYSSVRKSYTFLLLVT